MGTTLIAFRGADHSPSLLFVVLARHRIEPTDDVSNPAAPMEVEQHVLLSSAVLHELGEAYDDDRAMRGVALNLACGLAVRPLTRLSGAARNGIPERKIRPAVSRYLFCTVLVDSVKIQD